MSVELFLDTVTPQELNNLHSNGETIALLDVKPPVEFGELHAAVAHTIPVDSLRPKDVMRSLGVTTQTTLYVICRSGGRSAQACEKLNSAGLKAVNVSGGTLAWEAAKLPVVRGTKVVSLERQVRIVAGTLVFIGASLGYFVHPYFIGLAAFVGAGLAFAGITDTCAMDMLRACHGTRYREVQWPPAERKSHVQSSRTIGSYWKQMSGPPWH